VVALLLVPRPDGLLWDNLFNASHVATSFLLGLACLRLSRHLFARQFRSSWLHYLVSLGLVAAIGSGVEALQFIVPGTPSLTDLGRDMLGGLALVLVALSVDRRTLPRASRTSTGRWGLRGAAVFCFIIGLFPMLVAAASAAYRHHDFPRLARFDSVWGRHFVVVNDGAFLSIEPAPTGFACARGKLVAKVVFPANHAYPKLELEGPFGDWSSYKELAFDVFSPASAPISLVLRVHDRQHRYAYKDRFNTKLTIRPGSNTFSIPLDAVRTAPTGRSMDMAAIASVAVFALQPPQSLTLYLDDFRLR
jgi:VanZ family protein